MQNFIHVFISFYVDQVKFRQNFGVYFWSNLLWIKIFPTWRSFVNYYLFNLLISCKLPFLMQGDRLIAVILFSVFLPPSYPFPYSYSKFKHKKPNPRKEKKNQGNKHKAARLINDKILWSRSILYSKLFNYPRFFILFMNSKT